jgi:hypothetical protein
VYIPDEDDDFMDDQQPGENEDYNYGWDNPQPVDVQPDSEVTKLNNSLFSAMYRTLLFDLFSRCRPTMLALLPRLNPCITRLLDHGSSSRRPQPRALCHLP